MNDELVIKGFEELLLVVTKIRESLENHKKALDNLNTRVKVLEQLK